MLSGTKIFILYLAAVYICVTFWIIFTLSEFENRKLFVPAWYPVNKNNALIFSFLLIHQALGNFFSGGGILSIELFAMTLLSHLNAQILRLNYLISNIGRINYEKFQIYDLTSNQIQNKNTINNEDLYSNEVLECVILHQIIVK